ncbi:hypothetical protein [Marinomonas mediterranea]|uniref:hypothetical protein n=1 Tax=Marinomonas mediterranea TaxID=119864 RepID=UPI00234BD328|nr:hypothetical protein [Marinomonas mediterranea]WCN10718.1 type II site-specific deoxyribonuclease [Marinomonas mediterranea]WCN14774.1 type II site-specific deoxyribonuclease [Marinomonas mediterranea]
MIDSIAKEHKKLKKLYDKGNNPLDELSSLAAECLLLISSQTGKEEYSRSDDKKYLIYSSNNSKSRPVNSSLFIESSEEFQKGWRELLGSIDAEKRSSSLPEDKINNVIYTAIMGFCICFDIWKPKSRKTPGTHFEVLLGSLLQQFLPSFTREKFVTLPEQDEKVSTDIVFDEGGKGLVIPAKITTRERIVQPYAHQRILDSIFGESRYRSILLCVSETQRDDDNRHVNDICVPGTLKLFQAHLSKLAGLYYLDPPSRYMNKDISDLIVVGNFGKLLKSDLKTLVG